MLVLTRKSSESIVIGSNIVVTVLEVRGDQVRIGVDAPRSVQVHREEVYRQVAEENTAAVSSRDARRALLQRRAPQGRTPAPRHPGAAAVSTQDDQPAADSTDSA